MLSQRSADQEHYRAALSTAAIQRCKRAMADAVGLLPVAEAAAASIHETVRATCVTVILMDGDQFWDLVDVWSPGFDYDRFPVDSRYPTSVYPVATERLLSGRGYFTGDAVDEVLIEYRRLWPEVNIGSIMGVPIIAMGEVHGEIFLLRDDMKPAFDRDEMDLVADLATLLGARLPALLAGHEDASEPDLADAGTPGAVPRSRLTTKLTELLRPHES